MEKIISYFLPDNLNKEIANTVKERVLILFLLAAIALTISTIPIYIYLKFNALLKLVSISAFIYSAILIYYKFSTKFKIASLLFITYSFIYFFVNILYTGGLSSSLVIWVTLLPILTIILDIGLVKYTIMGSFVVLSLVFGLYYFGVDFPNEMEGSFGIYFNYFNRLNFMAIIVMIIFYYDQRKKVDREKLEKSNTDLEQFAYVASHDMKAPLRNMMNFAQLIQRKNKGKMDADSEKYIEYILSNGYQMNELIQSILTISKIEKQEIISYDHIDLNEIIQQVKSNIASQLAIKNAILEYHQLPIVSANAPQIVQIFQNLIENSIKYNQSKQPVISISHKTDKEFIHIYIKDNGIGIAPQYFDKIFEMFKRLHSNFEYKGTGIGLAICKKIALRHKGDLVVESSSDEGTIFKLSLPV